MLVNIKKGKISIVLPNIEEEAIFELIDQLNLLFKSEDLEIIVVNKSGPEYYKRLAATGVTIIEQKVMGVERAIMDGLKYASGEILASTDADGTHDSTGLVKGIEIVKSGASDFVLGNRISGLTEGSMSPHIEFGNSALSKIYSIAFNKDVHDVLSGLFVMSRAAYESIKDVKPYKAGIPFFAIEVAKRGFRISEVPIKYYPRKFGTSKLAKSKIFFGVMVALRIVGARIRPIDKSELKM